MKTSNYILIAFFIFLFGGILALYVDAKFHHTINNEGQYRGEEKKLEAFSVIMAEPGANFQISTAENPRILSLYQLPDSCKFPPFGIRNDTLFVFADPTTNKDGNRDIIYCKDIKSIIAKERTNLILQDFKIGGNDTISIKAENTIINIFHQDPNNFNGALFLESQESEIHINSSQFKTIDVNIEKSKIYAWNSSIGHLSGTIKNYSEIQATVMKKISVVVDSTSLFNIRK